MNRKSLLACLLALCLLMTSCSLIVKDPEVDALTPVLTVNGDVITKAEFSAELDNYIAYMQQLYSYYNMSLDPSDAGFRADAVNAVADGMIEQKVVAQKAVEMGADQLTEEDEASIREDFQRSYDTIKNALYADTELESEALESAIRADMSSYLGVTEEGLRETKRQNKLRDMIVADVKATEEEIQAEFDSRVASAKTYYE